MGKIYKGILKCLPCTFIPFLFSKYKVQILEDFDWSTVNEFTIPSITQGDVK